MPEELFLNHTLDDLYRYDDDPINNLRGQIQHDFVTASGITLAPSHTETDFVNSLSNSLAPLDRANRANQQIYQNLANVFSSHTRALVDQDDPLVVTTKREWVCALFFIWRFCSRSTIRKWAGKRISASG